MECLVKKLDYIDSSVIFDHVCNEKYAIFLDSSMLNQHYGRYSIIVLDPLDVFSATNNPDIYQQINVWNDIFANNHLIDKSACSHLPFIGGLVGFFSYDLGKQLEFISPDDSRIVEDFYLGLYNQAFIFDLVEKSVYILVAKVSGYDEPYDKQLAKLLQIYNSCKINPVLKNNIIVPSIKFKSNLTQSNYLTIIKRAKKYICDGDIFEVNLAQCFSSEVDSDYPCMAVYNKLREINPAPFSAYINLGSLVIMSASPERFLSVRAGIIEVRPIKGTVKRSDDMTEDDKLAMQLKSSEKDCAENVMIVDLMRNDLSKICYKDSVRVTQLCGVESFTNLHHLVSVVEGKLKESLSIFDIITAIFPGGSITGAPKIRAMQIIEELEPIKRGIYCGSIGYFSFSGNVDLSIAIRTIVKNKAQMSFYAGGAITLDSDPLSEYEESLLKAQKLNEMFK